MSEFENKNTQTEQPAEEFTTEQKNHMVRMTLLRHQITAHRRDCYGRLQYNILTNAIDNTHIDTNNNTGNGSRNGTASPTLDKK